MENIITDGIYSIKKDNNFFEIYCKDRVLRTPGGDKAVTQYLSVAKKLMSDWKKHGYESYREATSLLSFHFTMVQNFSKLTKTSILSYLNSMNWEKEICLKPCPSGNPDFIMKWMSYFGKGDERIKQIRKWLENQSIMQLVASTCIYNALRSYNVAYFMATIVENEDESKHKEIIKDFFDFYNKVDPFYPFDPFWRIFENFRLYYGIHFKEYGSHIPNEEEE